VNLDGAVKQINTRNRKVRPRSNVLPRKFKPQISEMAGSERASAIMRYVAIRHATKVEPKQIIKQPAASEAGDHGSRNGWRAFLPQQSTNGTSGNSP